MFGFQAATGPSLSTAPSPFQRLPRMLLQNGIGSPRMANGIAKPMKRLTSTSFCHGKPTNRLFQLKKTPLLGDSTETVLLIT